MMIKHQPLVSIIIVNFNGKNNLLSCLNSIAKNSYKNIEIIIIDNGSNDDSLKKIENKQPVFNRKFKIIRNKHNLGFAKANNQGLQLAKGEFILLVNNDVALAKNTIGKLIEKIKENKITGVVQPKIVFSDTKKLQSGKTLFTNFGFLYYQGYGKNPDDKKYNIGGSIFSANGACMLIRKATIKATGLFDNDFFAYYEETDFCHRAWLAGHQIIYEPSTLVFHKGAQTSKKQQEESIFFHSFKNRLVSTIKNFELKNLFFLIASLVFIYVFLVFFYLIKGKYNLSWAIIKALVWNCFNLKAIVKKRKKIQNKIRKISDSSYLNSVSQKTNLNYYLRLLSHKNKEALMS